MRPRQLGDLRKRLRICDGNVRQCLAVEFNRGTLQSVDQFAIAQAAHTAGSAQADDPQAAEHALAHATVTKGVDAAANERDLGLPDEIMSAQTEAFGEFS